MTVQAGPLAGMKKVGPFTDADAAFAAGAYEPEIVAALIDHCAAGARVLDIGANVGYQTMLLSRLVGESGCVDAFEPVPETASSLEETVRLNGLFNVRIHRLAIGAAAGTATMRVGGAAECGRAHIRDGTVGYRSELSGRTRTIEVSVASIDELRQSNVVPEPDLVKIDVEGAELLVLQGMMETLATARPVVVAELWGGHNVAEGERLLQSLGYAVSVLSEWRGRVAGDEVVTRNVLAVA